MIVDIFCKEQPFFLFLSSILVLLSISFVFITFVIPKPVKLSLLLPFLAPFLFLNIFSLCLSVSLTLPLSSFHFSVSICLVLFLILPFIPSDLLILTSLSTFCLEGLPFWPTCFSLNIFFNNSYIPRDAILLLFLKLLFPLDEMLAIPLLMFCLLIIPITNITK